MGVLKELSTNKTKGLILGVLSCIVILGIHIVLITKVSKLQFEIKELKESIDKKQIKYQSGSLKFESKGDYQIIRQKAEEELEMEISQNNIKYIEIN